MTDQISALQTILEASLVLLGFSGAVVALGDTPPRDWTGVNRMRIWTLIGISMTPLAGSALLIVLLHAGVNLDRVMQIGSLVCAIAVLYFAVRILLLNLRLPRDEPDLIPPTLLFAFQTTGYATAGLLIWNVFFASEFWPILLTFFLALLHGARMFARLLFRPV